MIKTHSLFITLLTSLVLSSCTITIISSSSTNSETSLSSSSMSEIESSSSSSSSLPQEGGYFKSIAPSITQEEYKLSAELFSMPTTGTVNLLVIPVTFSDFRISGPSATTRRNDIQKSFFGNASETGWQSVKSFYETSSYGNLTINGVVSNWYDSPYSTTTFASLTGSGTYASYYDPTWTMLNDAVSWYKSTTGNNLSSYDTDNDGYIDAVYLIYNNPNATKRVYSTAGQDVYWAYTYWNYNNWGLGNTSSPVGMTYAWSSFDFMYEGYGTSAVDAHTYIHEMGHVFGLDDYYSYTNGDWGAAGGIDMMDYNIVDHNAYSKYVLGWTNPFVLDNTQSQITITLNPFESSGDFILINNGWNGSAYDEYLAIEFYTPTGLNQKDSLAPYPGNGLQGFTIPGVRVYHIDSRLGRYAYSNNSFLGFTDTVNTGSTSYPYVAMSNSSGFSYNANWKLVHLLEAGGVNTFKQFEVADNDTLFTFGQTFNPNTTHSTFFNAPGKFNDNSNIGYSFTVIALTTSSVTLQFNTI
jgi:M6 family metalloprotease-like protein